MSVCGPATVTTRKIGKGQQVIVSCRHERMTGDLPKSRENEGPGAITTTVAMLAAIHRRKYPGENDCLVQLPSPHEESQARFAHAKPIEDGFILALLAKNILIAVDGDPSDLESFRAVIDCNHMTGELYFSAKTRTGDKVDTKRIWNGILECARLLRKKTKCQCIKIPALSSIRDDLHARLRVRGFDIGPN
jgi:hypothetical protein